MAVTTATVLSATAIVASLVGTGMAYYSQQTQARNAERMASYNAEIQRQNADATFRAQQASVRMQQEAAAQNEAAIRAQANAQTRAREGQVREELRRQALEKEKFLSRQRAGFAAAGVVMTGSPLAVLSDTAAQFELQANDSLYEANVDRQRIREEANSAIYGSQYQSSLLQLDSFAAGARRRVAMRQADLDLMSGRSQASGMRMQSYGTLISGIGSAAQMGYRAA